MRVGLIVQLNGRPDGPQPCPTWERVLLFARTAEAVGFDSLVFEDALLYRAPEHSNGAWESMTIAAGLAAATDRIALGQSVVNSPYRSPALTAKMAETIDEISGGRYILGIGAGNTDDHDYAAFGIEADPRYSRFAEAIEIVHGLLKHGRIDFSGEYYSAVGAELILRGPRPTGPPINIAAGGPKMLRLVARYGDEWNWWSADETHDEALARLRPIVDDLVLACEEADRDPATLVRTIDLYSVDPLGMGSDEIGTAHPIGGSAAEIAERILGLGDLGVEEVRCDLYPKTADAIEAMAEVVRLVHLG